MIVEEQTIWFPGPYQSREGHEWNELAAVLHQDELVYRVQRRALEDGTWCIENGLVGENNENEEKMKRMMVFVSDRKNILQCLDHIRKNGGELDRTVDWVCRELADASKVMVR